MTTQTDEKIRILVVDDVETSRSTLSRLLTFEPDMEVIDTAASGAEAIEKSKELQPHVILMDINMPDMDGLTATEIIARSVPTSVVMISVQSDRDYIRRALQVGATDFLTKPPTADELYDAIRRAYVRRPQLMVDTTGEKDASSRNLDGKLVVVYSPQGGAGVTTLSVNIATGLISKEESVVLVDANLQFGDVAIHLDLPNDHNILDLTSIADDLDPDLIDNILSTHASGTRVLAAPQRPEQAGDVDPENMSTVLQHIRTQFDYIVVDTAPHLDDVSLNLIEMADVLVLIGVPTLPAAKNLRMTLDLFEKIESISAEKYMFVMNQVPQDKRSGAINPESIAETLNLSPAAIIPFESKAILEAINRGVPVLVNSQQSPGKEIQEMIDGIRHRLFPEDAVEGEEDKEEDKPRRRWF